MNNSPVINELMRIAKENIECSKRTKIKNSEDKEESIPNPLLNKKIVQSAKFFEWMILPCSPDNFFQKIWSKTPLYLSREDESYYNEMFSKNSLDVIEEMLICNNVTNDIEIVNYSNKKKNIVINKSASRLAAIEAKSLYFNKNSIEISNVGKYHEKMHCINALLEDYFGTNVDISLQLYPPFVQPCQKSQDLENETFVLQIEGRRIWKIYKPSGTESIECVSEDSCIVTANLVSGDFLYIPRGYIYQEQYSIDFESFSVVIKTYKNYNWGFFIKTLIETSLNEEIKKTKDLQRNLPVGFFNYLGFVNTNTFDRNRGDFFEKLNLIFGNLVTENLVDSAADQIAKGFQQSALPPTLTQSEKSKWIYNCRTLPTITETTKFRLLSKNILRVVEEEESLHIYTHVNNSLVKPNCRDNKFPYEIFSKSIAPIIESLLERYPKCLKFSDIPNLNEQIITEIMTLWKMGVILIS